MYRKKSEVVFNISARAHNYDSVCQSFVPIGDTEPSHARADKHSTNKYAFHKNVSQ